jgi:hypothetical protein
MPDMAAIQLSATSPKIPTEVAGAGGEPDYSESKNEKLVPA